MRRPFDDAVRRHGPAVLRLARSLVGPDDADDVWSETFLAALRAWPDLPEDTNVEAWLVRVAQRKAVDHLRARSRRPAVELPPDLVGSLPDDDARLDVVAAVADLPDRLRLAVTYHHLAGMPWAQVATVLGCSPAAARRAGSDAVARLRCSPHLRKDPA